jgi:hypothetical protein
MITLKTRAGGRIVGGRSVQFRLGGRKDRCTAAVYRKISRAAC